MKRILLIEDEAVIRKAVRRLLERNGYEVTEAESVEQAEAGNLLQEFHLILSDIRLPGAPGTEIIAKAKDVPVLIITAHASVRSAVEAMKLGAVDYIAKPFDHEELLLLIERILRERVNQRQAEALKSDMALRYPVEGMVGRCEAMCEICNKIEKVAPTDATVLILGESGTGKELVARALHEKSKRNHAPFVAFNCAAVPDHLIEAELFGHHQDDRPGLLSKAEGGTLFLDEVGELPLPAQARLLRLLQSGDNTATGADTMRPLDVRIIATTHRDIRHLVQQGAFRSDLYFRLRVVEMTVPPLRERGDDLIELAVFLLEKARKQLNRPPMLLNRDSLEAIRRYHWPGNVRELSNAIERAVILCEGETITPDLLAIDHQVGSRAGATTELADKLSLEEYFRQFVLEHQDRLNETELAKKLGISRKALWERRQRFGLPRPKRKGG